MSELELSGQPGPMGIVHKRSPLDTIPHGDSDMHEALSVVLHAEPIPYARGWFRRITEVP